MNRPSPLEEAAAEKNADKKRRDAGERPPAGRDSWALAVPWGAVVAVVLINVLWGANVVAVKFSLVAIPPLWSAFWRFLLGAACLLLWARLRGVRLWPDSEEWPFLIRLGLFFTVQITLMNVGIDRTTGAVATVLVATNPLFAAGLAHFFVPGDRIGRIRGVGLLVAFGGVCLIFLGGGEGPLANGRNLGALIVLASAALLGGRLVYTAGLLRRFESTRLIFWQMLIALPCFAGAGWAFEEVRWEALGWQPVAAIFYQGVVIAALGFMVNAFLMKRYDTSVIISFNFVAPVSGVFLSALLLAEVIRWNLWAGLVTVGLGLVLIARK